MVLYAIDNNPRQSAILAIAVCSIAIGALIQYGANQLTGSYFVVLPLPFLIFLGLVKWLDYSLWRWKPVSWLVGVPDLRGTWVGSVQRRSHEGLIEEQRIEIEIAQTWSKIDVIWTSAGSVSFVKSASMSLINPKYLELTYIYTVHSRDSSKKPELLGNGTSIMRFQRADRRLEGSYFSDHFTGGNFTAEPT